MKFRGHDVIVFVLNHQVLELGSIFLMGFCCKCSTPDYITPDNQNLQNGFDCKVM